MALINCSECSKKISSKALACPSCGVVINVSNTEKVHSVIWTLLTLTITLLLMWVGWYFIKQLEASDSESTGLWVLAVLAYGCLFVGFIWAVCDIIDLFLKLIGASFYWESRPERKPDKKTFPKTNGPNLISKISAWCVSKFNDSWLIDCPYCDERMEVAKKSRKRNFTCPTCRKAFIAD